MKLEWGTEEDVFRDELVGFLDEHAPDESLLASRFRGLSLREGIEPESIPAWRWEWQRTLFEHRWLTPSWPLEFGGRNASDLQTLIYVDEMESRTLPRALQFIGSFLVCPSLIEFGTPTQKELLVRRTLLGELFWCIGMSERDAGSDLAALSTSAVSDGEGFLVNGHKLWTYGASFADWCFCYVRTDPLAPIHKGISVLLVDLKNTPGVEVRAIREITGGQNLAEIAFRDAKLPGSSILGPLNEGWRISMAGLAQERRAVWIGGIRHAELILDRIIHIAKNNGKDRDSGVRREIASLAERASSLRALGFSGFATLAQTGSSPEHGLLKLASTELHQDLAALAMEIMAPYGAVTDEQTVGDVYAALAYLQSFHGTIAAGTSEIQRNIIAERILGLPRESSPRSNGPIR